MNSSSTSTQSAGAGVASASHRAQVQRIVDRLDAVVENSGPMVPSRELAGIRRSLIALRDEPAAG